MDSGFQQYASLIGIYSTHHVESCDSILAYTICTFLDNDNSF